MDSPSGLSRLVGTLIASPTGTSLERGSTERCRNPAQNGKRKTKQKMTAPHLESKRGVAGGNVEGLPLPPIALPVAAGGKVKRSPTWSQRLRRPQPRGKGGVARAGQVKGQSQAPMRKILTQISRQVYILVLCSYMYMHHTYTCGGFEF